MINTFYSKYDNSKGLVFWDEKSILKREYIKKYLYLSIKEILVSMNSAWGFQEWEAPILTPNALINENYTEDDYFTTQGLAIRPETTMGSYVVLEKLIAGGTKLPLCVYQSGKSFRKEQSDQSLQAHKRLTEFYQMEFQCLYASSSKADYYSYMVENLSKSIAELTRLETRVVPSDRLPDYSIKTFDVEVKTPEKWLEICSISDRKDYSDSIKNLEIAFGLDRLVLV